MATGADVVNYARTLIGDPYVWGAEGETRTIDGRRTQVFDCSGLVQYVYRHFGLDTPRTTYQMAARTSGLIPIQRSDLQPGDLVFSSWGASEGPHGHVAIYTGRGTVIEAPQPGQDVMESPLSSGYLAHVDAFRRVPGLSGSASAPPSSAALTGVKAGDTPWPLNSDLFQAAVQGVAGAVQTADSVSGAITSMAEFLGTIAQGMAGWFGVGDNILKLFLPTNIMRAAALFFGVIFLLIGIWLIAGEAKDS